MLDTVLENAPPDDMPQIPPGEVMSPTPPPAAIAANVEGVMRAIRITALMTVPLCGYNPHFGCHSSALRPFGIGAKLAFGAFWHHGLSNLFEDCVDSGTDWILTLDYDSMFTAKHIDRLICQIMMHPEIDALAPLQPRRGNDGAMLVQVPNDDGKPTDDKGRIQVQVYPDQPIEAITAHFGLTLIKVEALKRMPMPWFLDLPNQRGSYRTIDQGRCDADMYFWRKWHEAGNKTFVDMHCRIGHLDAYVSEFDEKYAPRLVHVHDWRARETGSKVVHSTQNPAEPAEQAVAA